MNKFLIAVLLAVSTTAFAGGTSGTAGQKQSTTVASESNSVATSNNAGSGNGNSITFNQEATEIPTDTTSRIVQSGTVRQEFGTQKIKNTPSVGGPPLTSSNDTCMGSSSGSANGPGFGLSIGTTWTDSNCVMLKNGRELWNMGMKGAAIARLCMDKDNREALEMTGTECPQTTKAKEKANTRATAEQQQYTDPIVRDRLGLAPLPQ